jgi:hypothetical protein
MTSLNVVSLIAIVPESEWRMPTLTVSSAANALPAVSDNAASRAMAVSDVFLDPMSLWRIGVARL